MGITKQLLCSRKNLGILRELAQSGGRLDSIADLVDNFIDSDAINA